MAGLSNFNISQKQKMESLYEMYSETIKPLIADVEILYAKFPEPMFNEIRAYNDHISRCYLDGANESKIDEELKKAEGHLTRIVLDSFKILCKIYNDELVTKFGKKSKRVDFNSLNEPNFDFRLSYFKLISEAREYHRNAKKHEKQSAEGALTMYENAYNKYLEIEALIEENQPKIKKAFLFKNFSLVSKIITLLLTAFIGANVTGYMLSPTKLKNFYSEHFNIVMEFISDSPTDSNNSNQKK